MSRGTVITGSFLLFGVLSIASHAQEAQNLTADQQQKINDAAVKTKQAEADKAAADVKKAEVDLEASKITNAKSAEDLSAEKTKNALANIPNPDTKAPDGTMSVTDPSKLPEMNCSPMSPVET